VSGGDRIGPITPFLEPHHHEVAGAAARFAHDVVAPRGHPSGDDDARREAREIVAALGRAGLRPFDVRGACLVREAVAAVSPLADAVYALQCLGSMPLRLGGDETQKARWLPAIEAGRVMAGFAMTEPEAGSDVASMRTRARRDGGDYVLDGGKTLISNAGIADLYTVFAATDPEAGRRGISCFLVPAGTAGLSFAGAQVMAAPHPLGELAFSGCRVPPSDRLGAEGEGFALGLRALDRLRPTVAAAACGMAARALDEATRHAKTRRQFGKALAEFQLVQEKLARMATDLEASRLLVYAAARRADLGEPLTAAAAKAKAFATEAAQRIVDDAIQIVGGRALLADHPLDLLYRSVRALRVYEGTTEIQHLVIARELLREK
jgi:alkylation response protein AidB-like acyl-CoA dehydrogenase